MESHFVVVKCVLLLSEIENNSNEINFGSIEMSKVFLSAAGFYADKRRFETMKIRKENSHKMRDLTVHKNCSKLEIYSSCRQFRSALSDV